MFSIVLALQNKSLEKQENGYRKNSKAHLLFAPISKTWGVKK